MALFSSPFTSNTKVTKTQLDVLVAGLNAWDMGSFTALSGFASGYSSNDSAFGYPAGYAVRSLDGRVELRGGIKKNSGSFPSGSTVLIASLPGAIQPAETVEFEQAMTNSTLTSGRIEIDNTGGLSIILESSRGGWIALDGISYYVS